MDLVRCRCRGFSFSSVGDFILHHEVCCPYSLGVSSEEASLVELAGRLTSGSRTWASGVVDTDYDEYVPESFSVESIRPSISRFRNRSLKIGGQSLLAFRFVEDRQKKTFDGVTFRLSRLHVIESNSRKVKKNTKLKDVMASFAIVFFKIVEETKKRANPNDLIQFIVYTTKTPAYEGDTGMANPVSTPFVELSMLNRNTTIPFIVQNFKEYDHVTIGDEIVVESVLVRRIGEDSNVNHGSSSLFSSRHIKGVVRIKNNDFMCLARAVSVAYCHKEMSRFSQGTAERASAKHVYNLVKKNDSFRHYDQHFYAVSLCILAGVPIGEKTNDSHVEKISETLKVQIKIVKSSGAGVVRKVFGSDDHEKIYLLEHGGSNETAHFDAIVNMKTFKNCRLFCEFCDVGFNIVQAHICRDRLDQWCFSCFDRNCVGGSFVCDERCPKCNVKVRGSVCLDRHKKLKVCHIAFCKRCKRTIKKHLKGDGKFRSVEQTLKSHKCKVFCNLCGREKFDKHVHKCFMLRQKLKEKNVKYIFLDFETDQSSGVHIPIFCVLNIIQIDPKTEKIVKDEVKYFGVDYNVAKSVGDFLFSSKAFKDFTVIAHNMRGFDGCFLLRYLVENNIPIDVVCNGLKLTSIFVKSIRMRLIDSLNFFQMSLAGIVSAMGIEDIVKCKGYFPHFFTRPENINYIGPLPNEEFYGCFDMKSKQYKEFIKWHSSNSDLIFDFQKDIKKYCEQDVAILRHGCLKFRSLLMKIVSEISKQPDSLPDEAKVHRDRVRKRNGKHLTFNDDPFEGEIGVKKTDEFDMVSQCDPFAYMTAPGMCSGIFKAKFLKRNSIAQILPAGYENHRHSTVGIEYMEYLRRTKYPTILHALNTHSGQEVCLLGSFRVDGFVPEKNLAIEFYGCFWHGCSMCVKDMTSLHPVRKITYECLRESTFERENVLRRNGFEVEHIWECEWREEKKKDSVKQVTNEIFIKSRLRPRDAFKGGRVETGRLIWNIEDSAFGLGLEYVDICSLYPTVNCHEFYPVAHPDVITCNFDYSLESYFGLVQCSVIAPKSLLHAVLPVHANGKLIFPLCRTCAEKFQVDTCFHTDCERELHGVWVSEELKLAIREGYKITKVYCVHNFKRKSKDLFSSYIKTFFKLKLTSSKRPDGETPEEFESFVSELKAKDGIEVSKEEFHENPGVRSIAKLCCNCFWGRLGMRDSFPKVSLVYSLDKLLKLMSSSEFEVTGVRYVSDSCVAVLSKNNSIDTLNFTNCSNVYLALFTTASARIRLYELMKKVGERFVYGDTDSIIYEKSPNSFENLETGKFMGDLTSELDKDEAIVGFVSGGPKVYAFKTNKGKCVVKIKGFQLTERVATSFSFDNLKRVVETYVETHYDDEIERVRPKKANASSLREIFMEHHKRVSAISGSGVSLASGISSLNMCRIIRKKNWELLRGIEQKLYTCNFDKRIVCKGYFAVPYGYVK